MKRLPRASKILFIGLWLFFFLVRAGDGMTGDWRFFTSDKEFAYYLERGSEIQPGRGVLEARVEAVCVDREKFLNNLRSFGKPVKNYGKYSHTILEVTVDCSSKRYLMKLITEYDTDGKVINYVAGSPTNWLPMSTGTFGDILYRAACH
jgi:hypothetical protein